jgi:thiamine kinase-like enzyme
MASNSNDIAVTEHPAVLAWEALIGGKSAPSMVSGLVQEKHQKKKLNRPRKTFVYRIKQVNGNRHNIIAKRAPLQVIATEQAIYEDILPHLPLQFLQCYGSIQEKDYGWLFLEDSKGIEWSTTVQWQNLLVTDWLAVMHRYATEHEDVLKRLPDRGPQYYRRQMHSAKTWLQDNLQDSSMPAAVGCLIRSMLGNLDAVDSNWQLTEKIAVRLPRTLVHNDMLPKNVHLHRQGSSKFISIFDWEMSGYGLPFTDIYLLSAASVNSNALLLRYKQTLQNHGLEVSMDELWYLATIGKLFRTLDAIQWHRYKLTSPPYPHAMKFLETYGDWLACAANELKRLG